MNRSHLLASTGVASIFSALAAVLMFCTAVGIAAPDSAALGTGAPTSGSATSGTPAATAPGSPTSASPPGAGVPGAHQAAPRPSSASSPPPDALDRGTPRNAVAGFLEASGRGHYKRAA